MKVKTFGIALIAWLYTLSATAGYIPRQHHITDIIKFKIEVTELFNLVTKKAKNGTIAETILYQTLTDMQKVGRYEPFTFTVEQAPMVPPDYVLFLKIHYGGYGLPRYNLIHLPSEHMFLVFASESFRGEFRKEFRNKLNELNDGLDK